MLPIITDLDWGREQLSIAFATQNLMIGLAAPFSGALAAYWGATKTVALGGVIFGLGILMMSQASEPATMFFGAGLMAGVGLSACGMPLILAFVSQVAPKNQRSSWVGITTACATGGQLMIVPLSQSLIIGYGWVIALLCLLILVGIIAPLALSISVDIPQSNDKTRDISIMHAIREAMGHRSFVLLTAGFFVCGFHVGFIAIHLPAYLVDRGASSTLGATALMLIALFNMVGAWYSGWLADRISKRYILCVIYLIRSVTLLVFILVPVGQMSVLIFASLIGLLWLSTVPPTSGLISQIFGIHYMGVLYGTIYLSHQLGSFLGVWSGGLIFDFIGDYKAIWIIAVVLGFSSALIHFPIDEKPVERLTKGIV